MQIVENRLSDYVIVMAEGASEAQRYAATELAGYLARITGAVLPVVSDTVEPQEKEIVIGKTNRPGAPCGGGLKNDGYILKTVSYTHLDVYKRQPLRHAFPIR